MRAPSVASTQACIRFSLFEELLLSDVHVRTDLLLSDCGPRLRKFWPQRSYATFGPNLERLTWDGRPSQRLLWRAG